MNNLNIGNKRRSTDIGMNIKSFGNKKNNPVVQKIDNNIFDIKKTN